MMQERKEILLFGLVFKYLSKQITLFHAVHDSAVFLVKLKGSRRLECGYQFRMKPLDKCEVDAVLRIHRASLEM